MKFTLEPYNRNAPEEEMLADLRRVAALLSKDKVTMDEYNSAGRFHPCTLQRRFGSWFKALDRAGLKRTRNLGVTEEEWFRNLANVWEHLGRQPHYGEVTKPLSAYSASAYEKKFGTWRKALESFVEYMNSEPGAVVPEEQMIGTFEAECEPEVQTDQSDRSRKLHNHKTKRAPSFRLRYLVMRRDGFKCMQCGRSPATHPGVILVPDHVLAWANGGETTYDNLQTLCVPCNGGKSNL